MKKIVLKYLKEWGGDKNSFVSMLMRKAYYAGRENKKVFAFDKMRGFHELNLMLCIADDL